MRKMIAIVSALLIMAALTGCGSSGFSADKLTISEYNDAEVNTQVQLFIKQKTMTSNTQEAAAAIVNLTDKEFTFDAVQRLEVKLDGKWYIVPDSQEGIALAIIYNLPAERTEETMLYFGERYGELPQGEYRVLKLFTGPDGETAIASAEFKI